LQSLHVPPIKFQENYILYKKIQILSNKILEIQIHVLNWMNNLLKIGILLLSTVGYKKGESIVLLFKLVEYSV
jgi:hypothetical protein